MPRSPAIFVPVVVILALTLAAGLLACTAVRPADGEGERVGSGEGEGEAISAGEGEGEGIVAGEGEGEGTPVVVGEGEGEGTPVIVGEGEGEGSSVGVRPDGQCRVDADCPALAGVSTCNRNVPGGTCRCGDAFGCPATSTCNAVGVCLQDCSDDDDCPAGTFCGSQGCIASSCSGACADARYACDAGTSRCRRFTCAEGCPAGFACVAGVCVEP